MRSVQEWVGKSDDDPIPVRVKLRLFNRQNGRCARTGVKLRPGHTHADHIVPLAAGGRHAEDNIQLIAADAHREKTKADAAVIAKVRRIAAKHAGLYPPTRAPLRSRGFAKTRPDFADTMESDT